MSQSLKKEISTPKIFALCAGDGSRGFLYGIITTYMLTFFIPTTADTDLPMFLLSAGLAMAVIRSIGTIIDAVVDPFIANFSDRFQGKNGRRIPIMRVSAIPYALCCILIFFPPVEGPSFINAVWVGIMLCLYYLFHSFYNVPLLALQAEIVTTPKRRVFLFTISSLMFVVASALIYVTSALKGVFMAGGITELWALRIPFIIFAFLGMIMALIPTFAIKENDYVHPKKYSVPLWASLKATFSYRNYTIMTIGFLIMWMAFSFFNASLVYYIESLMGLPSMWVTIVAGISVVAAVITYPLLNILAARIGKKKLLVGACAAYVVIYVAIYCYAPIIGVIGDTTFALLIGICIAFPIAITNIIPSSIFADLAQYDTIKTGENRSGMFMAARNFIEKLAEAGIILVIPLVITMGSTQATATPVGIQTTALIAAAIIALALIVYTRYNEKEVSEVIAQDLAKEETSEEIV